MKDGLTFAFAVVGVVVGAGIASGQEIMQFFYVFRMGWRNWCSDCHRTFYVPTNECDSNWKRD